MATRPNFVKIKDIAQLSSAEGKIFVSVKFSEDLKCKPANRPDRLNQKSRYNQRKLCELEDSIKLKDEQISKMDSELQTLREKVTGLSNKKKSFDSVMTYIRSIPINPEGKTELQLIQNLCFKLLWDSRKKVM